MTQDSTMDRDDHELTDEALDRSGEDGAASRYCVGPRPSPKPSWIDRA